MEIDILLEQQIEQQRVKIDSIYQKLYQARLKNLTNPASLQPLWNQLSQEQKLMADLQLQDLNQQ